MRLGEALLNTASTEGTISKFINFTTQNKYFWIANIS